MDFEIRADGVLHIEGYVNAVERDSRIVMCPECGKCVEQIQAGAFGNALRATKNVDMLLNHDKGHRIASTSEGNLVLAEDSIGLRASADITDTEVVEKAKNGLLRGWSFGFKATDTEIEQRAKGVPRRHVKALSISAGCALASDHPDFSVERLTKEADLAMYARKQEYYRAKKLSSGTPVPSGNGAHP